MSKQSFNVERSLRLKPIDLTTLTGPKNGELAIDVNDSNKLKKYNEIVSAWEDTSPVEVTNYILNPNAQNNTFGWATYANTPGAAPISGTGGSPTVTLTRSTSAPLRGNASFLYTKPSSNVQGQGFSYDFTIDSADTGKVLQGSFDYQIASGTFADNDMSVWIYDITNARMIQPAPYLLKNSGIIEKFSVEFQTAINSTSYRLIIHQAGTSAVANTIKLDNFFVGPSAKLYGSAVTDPILYTPTGSLTTNVTYTGSWYREGKYLYSTVQVNFSGVNTQGNVAINLPAGLSIDTSIQNLNEYIGSSRVYDKTGAGAYLGQVIYGSPTSVSVIVMLGATVTGDNVSTSANRPITFDANDLIVINYKVPIQGWGSSQVMSSDASTRVVAGFAVSSSNTSLTTSATILSTSAIITDTHSGFSGNSYVVKVPGIYKIKGSVYINNTAGSGVNGFCRIMAGGYTSDVASTYILSGTTTSVTGELVVPLVAGQAIQLQAFMGAGTGTALGGNTTYLSVERISGPSQIMASETVACSYYNVAGTAIGAGIVTVPFPTKYFDTHNALNPATGVFTAPISGVYLIRTAITSEVLNLSTNQGFYSNIRRGGLDISSNTSWGNGVTKRQETQSSVMVPLLAGETISVVASSNVATTLSTGSQSHNNISIVRVGNY